MAAYKLTVNSAEQWANQIETIKDLGTKALTKGPFTVMMDRPKRSIQQNALMWKLLNEISTKVDWYGQKMTAEDWKHVFSASLNGQRSVPGLEGGFVVMGISTKAQNKEWLSNMIELIYSFGAEKGVKFVTNEYN